MLKLILRYLKPHWKLAAVTIVFIFVQVFTNLMLPSLMSDIVNEGVATADTHYILMRGAEMLGWTLACAGAVVISVYGSSVVSEGMGRDLRRDLFAKAMDLSQAEFDQIGTSSLITRTTNDVTQVERMTATLLSTALTAPVMFVGALVMVFAKSPSLSVVVAAAVPVMVLGVWLVLRRGVPLLRALRVRIDDLNRVTREGLTGTRVIRAFVRERYEEERFDEASGRLTETNIASNRLMGLLMPILTLIVNFTTIAVVAFGAPMVTSSGFMVGDLMAVIEYTSMVLSSITSLSLLFSITLRAMAAAERIEEVMALEPSVRSPEHPAPAPAHGSGTLSFDHVSFAYPGAERPALDDVSFVLEPGSTTVVIGSTGSGKSTLLRLFLRLADPTGGTVSLDGVDLRDFDLSDLRERISCVEQESVLFSGTVAENIRYANPEASDARVRHVAEVAQADDFVSHMPEGYVSRVAQKGRNLSGGQRQRIALARGIARDAEVYLFDDASSALDFATEARLRRSLEDELTGATVVIVTQRVSQAMRADNVLVLDEGRLVGEGSHQQLLGRCPVYAQIAASQLPDELLHPKDGPKASSCACDDSHLARLDASQAQGGER